MFRTKRVVQKWDGFLAACGCSPTESPLLFAIDPEPVPETLTALGGVPSLVQTFRSLGLPAQVREHVRIKVRERG